MGTLTLFLYWILEAINLVTAMYSVYQRYHPVLNNFADMLLILRHNCKYFKLIHTI